MVEEFKKNHKNSHLFKIDNFSLLKKHEIKRIDSSVFVLCGLKWRISVTFDEDKCNHVSIFLENQDEIDDDLDFQVYVVSQLEAKWHPPKNVKSEFGITSEKEPKGIVNLMSLRDLKRQGYLIEDCCMFGATLPDMVPARPGTAECFSLIEKPPNNKVTWMMTKFFSFDPEKSHLSNQFVIGNRKWRFEVHPGGFLEAEGESFSVFLVGDEFINNAPKTPTVAKYKLRVLDQVNRNHVEKPISIWVDEEYDDNAYLGFGDFMPLSKLKEPYLVNDKLYVGVEFDVISVTKYC